MDNQRTGRPTLPEMFGATKHPAEIFFGVAAFLFALWLLSQFSSQTKYVSSLPFSKQPGLFSAVGIFGMIVFGVMEIFFYWRSKISHSWKELGPELFFWVKALEYLVWFMVYVLVVPLVGYLPTTLMFSVLLALRLGYRSAKMIIWALITSAIIVVVFKSFLQVKIPGGVIYEYLPGGLRSFMILYL